MKRWLREHRRALVALLAGIMVGNGIPVQLAPLAADAAVAVIESEL